MKEVLRKLNEIDSSRKKDKKISLLRDFLKNDELFKRVVMMTTCGLLHYNIKTLPVVINNDIEFNRERTIDELFKHLDYLSKKSGANNKDKQWVAKLAANLECGTIVIDRLINGKLKCGATANTVNEAWPGLIFDIPYQRCSTESKLGNVIYESEIDGEVVKHGAYLDEKLDGMFFNIIVDKDKPIEYLSRNGKKFIIKNDRLDSAFKTKSKGFGVVWTAEGRIYRNGKFLDRKTGNGIIGKILKGTAKPEDHRDIVITVWEALPIKDFWNGRCDVPLEKRYNSKFFEGLTPDKGIIRIPKRILVFSEEEALDIANQWIEEGGEGGVLKNIHSIWKNGTSAHWIKLKSVVDCEMLIVGWEFGTKGDKFESCMGKIFCQSSDGLIKVKVGGGFSTVKGDKNRLWNWDEYVGKITTIRFSEMITKKGVVVKSLFLPRFIEIRHDKNTADSHEEILVLIKEAKKKSSKERKALKKGKANEKN